MLTFSSLATLLHSLAAVVWVGGMFFAHFALRPSLPVLEPPQPLKLWSQVFPRFFAWVWVSIVVLLASGYAIVFVDYGGFAGTPLYVHVMQGIGLVMVALFVLLYTVPFQRFLKEVAAENWPEAAKNQAQIRRIVVTNLTLGLITVAIGASGRFWN